MSKKNDSVFGYVVLGIGCVVLLNKLNILDLNVWDIISKYWYVIVILFGLRMAFGKNKPFGWLITVVFTLLFVNNTFNISISNLIWPLILIFIGLSIILEDKHNDDDSIQEGEKIEDDDFFKDTAILWERDKVFGKKDFPGGKVLAVCGEYHLDLRKVTIEEKARLELKTIIGEIKVKVPKNCRIVIDGKTVLGEWNSNLENRDVKTPVLEINGKAILGEISIEE